MNRSGGLCRLVVLAALWLVAPLPGGAEELARYRSGDLQVVLSTDPCGAVTGPDWRQARGRRGSRPFEGCWSTDAAGDAVVTTTGGESLTLEAAKLRLLPKYARTLQDIEGLPATGAHPSSVRTEAAFARPPWCPDAGRPHEKLICRDAELSAEDLKLAPLWKSFRDRMKLDAGAQRRHKDNFYRRLLACGADKACIASEQAIRIDFYRRALGRLETPG